MAGVYAFELEAGSTMDFNENDYLTNDRGYVMLGRYRTKNSEPIMKQLIVILADIVNVST